jgi:S-formylglutathione hydrolase FrmB
MLAFALATDVAAYAQSQVVEVIIHSTALQKNLLGDPSDQKIAIYLPAAYYQEQDRRFATIYFLHGFADTPAPGVARVLQPYMDKLIGAHTIEPMIVVAPNGLNRFFGSFYTNSEVTGNWEDYIFHDVVGYMDAHYRTIPTAQSRGIGGHSMGGYGALMLGFKHPEVFSNIYAMSPCCTLLDADLGPSNSLWGRIPQVGSPDELADLLHKEFMLVVFVAMDAAFAPDPRNQPLLGDPPFRRRGEQIMPDAVALAKVQANMVTNAIPALLPRIYQLKGIYIDYGAEDEFSHIPPGARAVSAQLAIAGVPHTLETTMETMAIACVSGSRIQSCLGSPNNSLTRI